MNFKDLESYLAYENGCKSFIDIESPYDIRLITLVDMVVYLSESLAICEDRDPELLIAISMIRGFALAGEETGCTYQNKAFSHYPLLKSLLDLDFSGTEGDKW